MSLAGCTSCGESFASDRAFDRHRVGTFDPPARRCLSPNELLAAGWRRNRFEAWTPERPFAGSALGQFRTETARRQKDPVGATNGRVT
jgi:hypothetical protein